MSPTWQEELIALLCDSREEADRRGDAAERGLAALDHRLAAIERRLAASDAGDPAAWRAVAGHQRLARLEHRVEALGREVASPRAEALDHLDEVDRRLDRLEDDYRAIAQSLERVEGLLSGQVIRAGESRRRARRARRRAGTP